MKKSLLLLAGVAISATAWANWGDSVEKPVSLFPTDTRSYATELKTAADGSAWAVIYHPNLKDAEDEFDTSRVVYEYRLQHYDADGNATFPDEGILLSDYSNISFTVVNSYLLVDSDGNAVVSVTDCRNSGAQDKSYTAYKVNPQGELLWGEEGKAISDPAAPADLTGCMNIIELEDGSYVFAWTEYGKDGSSHVCMQRFDHDGNAQWDLAKTAIKDEMTSYPYLVNSGDNTFILVYGRTASTVLYARKLDFEAESVWGKDVRIYRGGWGTIPPHTRIEVKASGDGGALIAWNDDRANTNIESAFISYVTPDGKLGFAGASDEGDVKLCYDGWRCFNVSATPAADGSCFYAVWRRTDPDQNEQAIMMQKISRKGELLWGDDAKELSETKALPLGYVSLQPAGENDACAFYETYYSYFDQQGFAVRFDGDGNFVWGENPVAVTAPARMASNLQSQPYRNGEYWLLTWTDGGTSADDKATTYLMTVLGQDGKLGVGKSAVEAIASAEAAVNYSDGILRAEVSAGTLAAVYTPAGTLVAETLFTDGAASLDVAPGLYIVKAGDETFKILVK